MEQDFKALVRLSVILNSEDELEKLLELIVKECNQLVAAEQTLLFLTDEENRTVNSKVTLPDKAQVSLPLGRGIVGTVAFSGKIINILDTSLDSRHSEYWPNFITRNLLTVPLRTYNGQIIGVVQALNKKGACFDSRDEELLEALCDLAAVAIERAKITREQKRLGEELSYQARHDALTGLPNRVFLEESLGAALAEAEQKGNSVAVLFVDLDRFKLINDSLGHGFGDMLLQQVAHRLQSGLRFGDVVARHGGDEFVVVLRVVRNVLSVHRLVHNLQKSLQQPFYVEGQELYISASIGVSLFPQHGHNVTEVLRNADTAMYKAKDRGQNGYEFFQPEMSDSEQRRLWLVTQLHKALEFNELELYFQPQLDLGTNQITGAEALIRWKHPELGLISPGEFIPLAEETGLIVPVGTWVLREACRLIKTWQIKGLAPFRISVNVSALQFGRDDFLSIVTEALESNQLEPEWLELELTEGLLIGDTQSTIKKINRLKAMGISFAIDDFGTGYSSLGYLQQLSLNTLKIDQSFVRKLGQEGEDNTRHEALLRAITTLAHNLNMRVIAEGVETEKQKDFLESIGCEEIQGFFFSRPLPVAQFEEFIFMFAAANKQESVYEAGKLVGHFVA
ncbi:MAG TPA: EAL domain-containing protein [Chloroflexia bacterium]|nr:EAL domain-containing protein [Chloroflexia bacterium]